MRLNLTKLNDEYVDDYVLGVFCAKTRLVDYCRKCLEKINEGERNRLFELGIKHADNLTFKSIGKELDCVMKRQPDLFKKMVLDNLGNGSMILIEEAIEYAKEKHENDPL